MAIPTIDWRSQGQPGIQVGGEVKVASDLYVRGTQSAFEAAVPLRAGQQYTPSVGSSPTTLALAVNSSYAIPLWVRRTQAFGGLANLYVSAAAAGATALVGIYDDAGTGLPGTLVVDLGTHAADTVGPKSNATAFTLNPGLYWVVVACKGAAFTVLALTGGPAPEMIPQPGNSQISIGYRGTNTTAGLKTPFVRAGEIITIPRVALLAA